jgi:hypothetical protein
MMLTESLKREIKALAKVLVMLVMGRYFTGEVPTFFDVVIMYHLIAVYERMNQTDFWIMRG